MRVTHKIQNLRFLLNQTSLLDCYNLEVTFYHAKFKYLFFLFVCSFLWQ